MNQYDEDDEGLGDHEAPNPSDTDDPNTDSADTVECPDCRRQVYENTDQCPYCGQFLPPDGSSRKPVWLIVGVVACLVVVVLLWLR